MSYNPNRTGMEPAMTHPLIALARQSVSDPRGAARRLIDRNLPPPVLVDAAALVAVLSGISGWLFANLLLSLPAPPEVTAAELAAARGEVAGPLSQAMVQARGMVLIAAAIWILGRMFGGVGRAGGAVAITIWLSALSLAAQIVLIVLLALAPPIAVLALIGWVVLNIWLLTSFIAELHDFDSAWSVFFAILGLAFLLALGLALFGSLLGGVAGG